MLLLTSLREPVDRAFSDYLDLIKNQQFDGSFEAAIERFPGSWTAVMRTHLERYLEIFPAEQLHLSLRRPRPTPRNARTAPHLPRVDPLTSPPAALTSRMPAGSRAATGAASAAKAAARMMGRLGLRRVRSRAGRSARVRNAPCRPWQREADDRPRHGRRVAPRLRGRGCLDRLLPGVASRWGYAGASGPSAVPGPAVDDCRVTYGPANLTPADSNRSRPRPPRSESGPLVQQDQYLVGP